MLPEDDARFAGLPRKKNTFGGGTLRDLLLDRRPFFGVQHVELLWGVMALCVLAMLFLRQHHFELTEKAIQWPDALGWMALLAGVVVTAGLRIVALWRKWELPGWQV